MLVQLAVQADNRHIALHFEASEECYVMGHAESLLAMLSNNLINAIKYSPDNRSIRVRLSIIGDWIRLSVTDQDKGIPIEHRQFALQRFHSLESNGVQGTGLGLSILHNAVQMHQCRLRVEVGDDQLGLTVVVELRSDCN